MILATREDAEKLNVEVFADDAASLEGHGQALAGVGSASRVLRLPKARHRESARQRTSQASRKLPAP